nr:hydrogenase iron-sulfur subunit [Candidatus Njordarchaeota archaeon]
MGEYGKREEPRVGVFICQCGTNIGGVVNCEDVVEYARTLSNVAHSEYNMYTCSEVGLSAIKEAIKKHNLNRVVVASCTPRTHETLFRRTCKEAGLNEYLFEFANIREQCSWVHMNEPEKATGKAKDIVRMAVARASELEPRSEVEVDVDRSCLVIGGGIAGLTAASSVARQGFKVTLVEKESKLGGKLKQLHLVYPTFQQASEILQDAVKSVSENENIQLLTSSTVEEVSGFVGSFEVTVRRQDRPNELKVRVGTIIVATGATNYEPPRPSYGYGVSDRVVTQLKLEEILRENRLGRPESVVMVQCVGARKGETWTPGFEELKKSGLVDEAESERSVEEGFPYCSKICCVNAIKNALIIKDRSPNTDVIILYSDIRAYKEYERLYSDARKKGVKFIRYIMELPVEVKTSDGGKLDISFFNTLDRRKMSLLADYAVLSTPLAPSVDNLLLSKTLRIPIGADGFLLEAHPKLGPVDTSTQGIFLAGTAAGPLDLAESITSAKAATARASSLMTPGRLAKEAVTTEVNPTKCDACGLCEAICPFVAPRIVTIDGRKVSQINPILCNGCGTCVAACPRFAITLYHYKDDQIVSQVRTAFSDEVGDRAEPRILMFTCTYCSYAGADLAGVSRLQYPTNVRILRLPCSGRVDPYLVFEAFKAGADGVIISGCHPGDCHFLSGNRMAEQRYKSLQAALDSLGVEKDRVQLEWISASEGQLFAKVVKDMTDKIRALGPNPMRVVKE